MDSIEYMDDLRRVGRVGLASRSWPTISSGSSMPMIVAFAGRRIDAPNAEDARFPGANVAEVRARIQSEAGTGQHDDTRVIRRVRVDLIALDVAGALGVRRVVVLPWESDPFERTPWLTAATTG